jgi:hypothetical protein
MELMYREEVKDFLLMGGLLEVVLHFMEEELVFGHFVVEEHLGGELLCIKQCRLEVLNQLQTDLLFGLDELHYKIQVLFELLFGELGFGGGGHELAQKDMWT